MSKFLLDYVFPISQIVPTPEASTAFLKQACLVCTPKSGQEGNVGDIFECDTVAEVAARTDNTNASQLFNGGMSKVYILLASSIADLSDYLEDADDFYTVLLSSDFDEDDLLGVKASGYVSITNANNLVTAGEDEITVGGTVFVAKSAAVALGDAEFSALTSIGATAISLAAQINGHDTVGELVEATVVSTSVVSVVAKTRGTGGNSLTLAYSDEGTATVGAAVSGASLTGGTAPADLSAWKGVFGASFLIQDDAALFAATELRSAWMSDADDKAKNMCFAFGKLLSNLSNWTNQQYITMPFADGATTLGAANSFFDDKISFVLTDDEFGTRLGLFAVGGKAIVAPYILKNLMVNLQSRALSWISGNQPQYTLKEASLLETRLQEDVINSFIARAWITAGTVLITLEEDNFVASGDINVSEPKALWRVFSQMQQTL